ncbi:MAG: DUF971 domain-containing protein [Porticoccaceae bacterium]|nr:DUF971 domain-containing protein [Porticoccaceae bacterium]
MDVDRPHSVKYKKQSEVLELIWADGSTSLISGQKLRKFCACSSCRAKKQVGVDVITDGIQVASIAPIGTSGIQVVFSDGHDRGIYPWDYLHAIATDRALDFIT